MNKTNSALDILIVAVGLMMIVAPAECVQVIVILLGLGAVVSGIMELSTGTSLIPDTVFKMNMIIQGWLSIVVGILAIALPLAFAKVVWTAMVYILAVYLLVLGGLRIAALSKLRAAGIELKKYIFEIIASFAVAVVLFCIPAALGKIIIRIIGIAAIAVAAGLFYYQWKNRVIVESADFVADAEPSGNAADSAADAEPSGNAADSAADADTSGNAADEPDSFEK